jgi:Cytochrome C oxidase, cbb3-type, subunit III
MRSNSRWGWSFPLRDRLVAASLTFLFLSAIARPTLGGDHSWKCLFRKHCRHQSLRPEPIASANYGEWYWMRSPEQEKMVAMSLYNRYCIRCHGVDGRGVWDIPGVPDFTDVRWQNCRTDAEIVRILMEGRGAVMPSFRGTLALDECWGLARYLRSFVPGSEISRPVLREPPSQPATPSTVTSGSAARSPTPAASIAR